MNKGRLQRQYLPLKRVLNKVGWSRKILDSLNCLRESLSPLYNENSRRCNSPGKRRSTRCCQSIEAFIYVKKVSSTCSRENSHKMHLHLELKLTGNCSEIRTSTHSLLTFLMKKRMKCMINSLVSTRYHVHTRC